MIMEKSMARKRHIHKKYSLLLSFAIVYLLLLNLPFVHAQQDSSYTLLRSMASEAKSFTTDKLQQSYLINSKNQITKYSAAGQEVFNYNNNTLGNLHVLDATNPFNLLLYYPDFQTVITLDRTLNETGEINLFDLDIINVPAIASSNDNNVWIYDDAAFKLKKIDQSGQVLVESDDLSLLLGQAPRPIQIKARENWVYMNDPDLGILIFDGFAQYHKQLDLKNVTSFQLIGEQLIYAQAGKYYNFNLKSFLTKPVLLPKNIKPEAQLSFQKNHLYVLYDGVLKVYRFQ